MLVLAEVFGDLPPDRQRETTFLRGKTLVRNSRQCSNIAFSNLFVTFLIIALSACGFKLFNHQLEPAGIGLKLLQRRQITLLILLYLIQNDSLFTLLFLDFLLAHQN